MEVMNESEEDSQDEDGQSNVEEIEKLRDAVASHQAWLSIDVFSWPQDLTSQSPVSIPNEATKRIATLAKQMVGERALAAYHCDGDNLALCDETFFDLLAGDDPILAFWGDED